MATVKWPPSEDEISFAEVDQDYDYALAYMFQEQENAAQNIQTENLVIPEQPISVISPDWETLDPNPDIHKLFIQFNYEFFYGALNSVEVRWSPRMTLCAGLCVYQGKGGYCSVRLSQPLLKFRPRKDMVETLLHEMIHAYLFVTRNFKDHDDHGPEFKKHMNRINQQTGSNISVYHNFNEEVDYQRQHWWKCDGRCQQMRPYFGIVKRAMNREPSPKDRWWQYHQDKCGGKFTKIREPENYGQKNRNKKTSPKVPEASSNASSGDIRNFFPSSSNKHSVEQIGPALSSAVSSFRVGALDCYKRPESSVFPGKGHVLGSGNSNGSPQSRLVKIDRNIASAKGSTGSQLSGLQNGLVNIMAFQHGSGK